MFSDRPSHYHPGNRCFSRDSGSHRLDGLRCESGGRFNKMDFGSRHSTFGRQYRSGGDGEKIGWGRSGDIRLDDTPMIRRGGGSMSVLMDGMGELHLGGGGSRCPLMSRSPLGSSCGSPLFGRERAPLDDGLFWGGGSLRRSFRGPGMGMGGLGSQDRHLSPRAGLLGSGLLGPRSPAGSSRASGIFNPRALDRPRMSYGPLPRRLSNYRPPFVEDYFSDADVAELAEMEELERRGLPFWYDDYLYDDDF